MNCRTDDQHSPATLLTRAVQYVRMSTEHQRFSIAAQKAVIADYAQHHGYEIVDTYSDPGKSGLSLKGRKELQRLLADVLSPGRKFDAILILDVSRWGRFQDPDQAAHYEFICRQAGVTITYCAEPFASSPNPFTALIKQVKRVMAGEYSRELSVKTSRARAEHARKGLRVGGPSVFGFRRQVIGEDGKPGRFLERGELKELRSERVRTVLGPLQEIRVIRRIFDLYVRRQWSRADIVRHLNKKGIVGHQGRRWTTRTIRNVLTNEYCIGRYTYNRTTQKLQTPRRNNPETLWIRTFVCQPIVSEAIFKRAQERLAEQSPKWRMLSTPESRERMLNGLRDLWAVHGSLSQKTIDTSPLVPSVSAYAKHFGSFTKALNEIGYVPPMLIIGPNRSWSKDDLRKSLKRLYEEHGYLSIPLMMNDPELPSMVAIQRKIGGLAAVYKFIGAPEKTQAQIMEEAWARRAAKMRGRPAKEGIRKDWTPTLLVRRLKALLAKKKYLSGPLINAEPTLPCSRTIEEHFGSLMNAFHAAGWKVDRSDLVRLRHARMRSQSKRHGRTAGSL